MYQVQNPTAIDAPPAQHSIYLRLGGAPRAYSQHTYEYGAS